MSEQPDDLLREMMRRAARLHTVVRAVTDEDKPNRRALLKALTECQGLFGRIQGAASDRNPNRAADIARLTKEGFDLCVKMRSFDPP